MIVDEINGFAIVGGGHLALVSDNPRVSRMVEKTDRWIWDFAGYGWPIPAFLDTHVPGKPEPPYPPDCEQGTGGEEPVDDLKWLEGEACAILVCNDCINGFVGAIGGMNATWWSTGRKSMNSSRFSRSSSAPISASWISF